MFNTQAAQNLGLIIEKVCCSYFSSMQRTEMRQPIGMIICSEHGWIVSTTSFDESGSAGCPTWRGKMHIYTSRLTGDILETGKIFWDTEIKLYNRCHKSV